MLAIILLLKLCLGGHIYTWDPIPSYSMQGTLNTLLIPFKIETSLQMGLNYLHFGGIKLHSLNPSEVLADIQFINGTIITTQIQASISPPSNFINDYFIPIIQGIPSNQWMNLILHATGSVPGLPRDPIYIRTVSSLNNQAIIYDRNMQAGHVNVAPLPQSGLTILTYVDPIAYPNYRNPGAIYEMNINIIPRIPLKGFQIVISIATNFHTEGLLVNDFFFQLPLNSSGCSFQDIPALGLKAFTSYTCTVEPIMKLSMTLTSQQTLVANQQVSVRVNVQNPPYVSVRDLQTITIGINQGNITSEKGTKNNVFNSQPIPIQTTQIQYLWGIDMVDTITLANVQLWAAENPLQVQGPYNSINVKFTVLYAAPPAYPQNIRVKLSCTHALASSTNHNLQPFDQSQQVYCQYTFPYMVCFNVGNLAPSFTYFISTKIYFSAPIQIQDFGVINIQLTSPNPLKTISVYQDSIGVYQNVLSEQNLYDIGGWHGPTGGLSYTQVSSIQGTTLTKDTLKQVLGPSGSVGIVPSYGSPSSLLFFMQTDSIQYCGPSTLATDLCGPSTVGSKYLKMTIMLNSLILTSDPLNLPTGLQYLAADGRSSFTASYGASNFPCFSAGYCDQAGQNGFQIINQNSISSSYGIASFECGILTQPGDVVTNCNMFQGATTTSIGSSGIISLPQITWKNQFLHSSQYADETLLDFVVTFYEGDLSATNAKPLVYNYVSSHLINAYTVDNVIPSNLQVSFVNYYMGATKGNDGWIIPTLMRVKGTVTNADLDQSNRISVFFDQSILPVFFGQANQYSCSSGNCLGYQVNNPGIMDNWQHQSGVDIGISQQTFDIVFPVSMSSLLLPQTIYLVLSESISNSQNTLRSPPYKVYRMNGAAILSNSQIAIPVINNYQQQAADLMFPYINSISGSKFDLNVDLTSISQQYQQSQLRMSTSKSDILLQTNKILIGSGLTISSVGQNIFGQAQTVQLQTLNIQMNCLPAFKITRSYSAVSSSQDVNSMLARYTVFCPFDSPTQYPLFMSLKTVTNWPMNYFLSTQISYSISDQTGKLSAATKDSGVVNRLMKPCQLGVSNTIYPNSLGRQRVLFPVRLNGNFTIGLGFYPSVTMQVAFGAPIIGFELSTSSSNCILQMPDPQLPISCVYTWNSGQAKATIIVSPIDPTQQVLIPSNQNFIIIIPINPTYGLIKFGTNQPVTFSLYVPTIDQTSGKNQIFGNAYSTPAAIQEQCTNALGLNLTTTAMDKVFNLSNLRFDIPNQYAASIQTFEFGVGSYRDYVPADSTTFQFDLGFLQDPNNQPNLLLCQVYDKSTNQSSQIWSYIDNSVAGRLKLYLKQDLSQPNKYTFIMKCLNVQTPGPAQQLLGFQASWIETTGQVIVQQATALSYSIIKSSLQAQNGILTNQTAPVLMTKSLNSPGYGAIYSLTVNNGALRILYSYRIYVRFHTSIAPKFNRLGLITCLLNQRSCYCEIQDGTIKIWPSLNIEAKSSFNITLSQIEQPSPNNWPLKPYIWVGIDKDNDLSNGVYFSSFTSNQDVQPFQDPITSIQMSSMTMSGSFIRTEQTHTLSVQLASGTMTAGNMMYVEFPQFYIESLQLKSDNSFYNFTQLTCILIRQNDPLAYNFVGSFDVISGTLIAIILQQDNMNNFQQLYQLTIGFIPLPRTQIPNNPLNNFKIIIHITGPLGLKVKFTTALYTSPLLQLAAESTQEVYWSGSYYQYSSFEQLSLSQLSQGSQGIQIQQGVFKTMMQLTPQLNNGLNQPSIFNSTFGYQFDATTSKYFIITYPTTLTANSGDPQSQLLIAAQSNLLPGSYVFPVLKLAGGVNYVNTLPYINFFVVNDQCQLQTNNISQSANMTYTIPIGGISEPIIINVQECYPTQDLRVTLIDPMNYTDGLQSVLPNPQSLKYSQSSTVSVQGTLYFKVNQFIFVYQDVQKNIIQQNQELASNTSIGKTLVLSFLVEGENSAFYIAPPPILLKYIDPSTLNNNITVNFTLAPEAFQNTMRFYLNCSDSAYLYWVLFLFFIKVIGVGGDISYIPWMDIRNETLYSNTDRTHRDPTDTEWKIYGFSWYNKTTAQVVEYFTNLKQNDFYTLSSYCVNQMGLVSQQFTYQWQTPSNGGQTIKVIVSTNNEFSLILQSALVCAMNQIFPINPQRVLNQLSTVCDVNTINQVSTGQVANRRMLQNLQINYTNIPFYVIGALLGHQAQLDNFIYLYADQSLVQENLTPQVLSQFNNISQFIQQLSTNMNLDPEQDPLIKNVAYIFPTLNIQPQLTYTAPEVSSTSVRMNFTLQGVNGFVGVGLEQTDTSPNPTILQLRQQTNYLNRPLLQSFLLFFNETTKNTTYGQTKIIIFYNLVPNLKYKIYWFSSNDDPGPSQLSTQVNSTIILTQPVARVIYSSLVSISIAIILNIMI